MICIPWEYVFAESFKSLHRYLADSIAVKYQDRKPPDEGLTLIIENYLKVVLLRKIYSEARMEKDCDEICQYVKNSIEHFNGDIDLQWAIGIEEIKDDSDLYFVFRRGFGTRSFFSNDPVANYCVDQMGGGAFIRDCASSLVSDLDWQVASIETLIKAFIVVELSRRVTRWAWLEFSNRVAISKELSSAFFAVFDYPGRDSNSDDTIAWTTQNVGFDVSDKGLSHEEFTAEKNNSLERLMQEYMKDSQRFKVEGDGDYLQTYIADQLGREPSNRLSHLDVGKYINKLRDKERKRASKFGSTDSNVVPLVEILAIPKSQEKVEHPTFLGKEFSDAQNELLLDMLETQGEGDPETGVKIMAQLAKDGASFNEKSGERTRGEKKEDAQAVGVSESTLGRYVGTRTRKGILSQLDPERLEEILRRDCFF